jgi:hypothetical protein
MESTGIDEARRMLRGALTPILDGAAALALTDDQVLDLLREVESVGRLVDAARVTLAGEAAARSGPENGEDALARKLGCRNAGELVERTTRVAGSTARARITTAKAMRPRVNFAGDVEPARFDRIRESVAAGRMSVDEAGAILRSLGPIHDRVAADDLAKAEAELVEAAEAPTSTADTLAAMAQVWALYLDPDGTLPREVIAMRERGVTLGRERDGTIPIRGALLPEVAAQLSLLFDAYLNPRVGAGPVFREQNETEPSEQVADDRTGAQRRHDAFAGILGVAAKHHDTPSMAGAAPTLVVTVAADQLDRTDGVAFLPATASDSAGAVSAAIARHTGCAGAVQRVTLGPAGQVLRLESPERTFDIHRRRAIAARDGTCVIPGCTVPARWCEIHHVDPAARGGPTSTDNGVTLCWIHHRTIDTSGWRIRMKDGVPWVQAPYWIDPARTWRPSPGSAARRLTALRN